MEERKTIFDYIGQAFMTFGFTMLILLGFTFLFGEGAKEYSTIFSLGKEGIGADTMAQFLLAAVVTVALRALFYRYAVSEHAHCGTDDRHGIVGTRCYHYYGSDIRVVSDG